jgi:ribosomal protein S18 acetylase RimI-like enzyme
MSVDIRPATFGRLQVIASVLGRAFVTEPMMRWPFGVHGDVAARFTRVFEYFLPDLIELGAVSEAGDGLGAAVWIPPEKADAWDEAQAGGTRMHDLTDDGGRRYDRFWDWVESRMPTEAVCHLDSIGVAPEAQGRGVGSALMAAGLSQARAKTLPVFLETATPENVPYYERFGFRIVDDADAPDGGPHVWFMRCDPV